MPDEAWISNIEELGVGLFACPNLQGLVTPLIFKGGDGGEVLDVKNLPDHKCANWNQLISKQV